MGVAASRSSSDRRVLADSRVRLLPDDGERNPVQHRVVLDGAGVGSAGSQRGAVGLAGAAHVGGGDGGEGDELHLVNFDLDPADAVATADLDLTAAPQPEGQRDVAGRDVVVKLAAELHGCDATSGSGGCRPAL